MLTRPAALARAALARGQARGISATMYEQSLLTKRVRGNQVRERVANVTAFDERGEDKVEGLRAREILQGSLAENEEPRDLPKATRSAPAAVGSEVDALEERPVEAYVVLHKLAERRQSALIQPDDIALAYSKPPVPEKDKYAPPLVQIRNAKGDRILGYGLWKRVKQQVFVLLWTANPRDARGPKAPKLRNLDALGIGRKFWFHKFYAALEYRQAILNFEECSAFVLLNGSADSTPGLHCSLFSNCAAITIMDSIAVHILPYLLEFLLTRTPVTVIHVATRSTAIAGRVPERFQGYYPDKLIKHRKRVVTSEGMVINLDVTDRERMFQPSKRTFRGAVADYAKDRRVAVLGDRNGSDVVAALLGGAEKVFVQLPFHDTEQGLATIQGNVELNFFTDELKARDALTSRGFAQHTPNLLNKIAYEAGKPDSFFLKVVHGAYDCFVLDFQGSDPKYQEPRWVEHCLSHAITKVNRSGTKGGTVIFISIFDHYETLKMVQTAAQRTRCDVRLVESLFPAPDAGKSLQTDARPEFTGWVLNVRTL